TSDGIPTGGGRGGRAGGGTAAAAGRGAADATAPEAGRGGAANAARGGRGGRGGADGVPEEFRDQVGNVTLATTGPQLRKFVEDGGTLLAIGSSANIGYYLGLPMTDASAESVGAATRRLPATKFYIPGSILQASVDN